MQITQKMQKKKANFAFGVCEVFTLIYRRTVLMS